MAQVTYAQLITAIKAQSAGYLDSYTDTYPVLVEEQRRIVDGLMNHRAAAITGAISATTLDASSSITSGASILATSTTGLVGYDVTAGDSVTQLTNASTAVTLDTPTGQINTVALTTAGAAEEAFTFNNALLAAEDLVVVNTTYAGQGKPIVFVTNNAAGSCVINITNVSASALNALMVINFAIIKGGIGA